MAYRIGDEYSHVYESPLISERTIDHITPLAEGGTHTADNLCVTSLPANSC
jgi:hypothetical protein